MAFRLMLPESPVEASVNQLALVVPLTKRVEMTTLSKILILGA